MCPSWCRSLLPLSHPGTRLGLSTPGSQSDSRAPPAVSPVGVPALFQLHHHLSDLFTEVYRGLGWSTRSVRAFLIAQLIKNLPACRIPQFDSWVRKICWRRDRLPTPVFLGFPCGSAGKESHCKARDLVQSLGWEDPLEKGKATHSTILAWRIHGLYSLWSRQESDTTEQLSLPQGSAGFPGHSALNNPPANAGDTGSIPGLERSPWRRKWQPTPVFLPGKSHGPKTLVCCSPWSHKESDST